MSFDVVRAIFDQIDVNRTGRIKLHDFVRWLIAGNGGGVNSSSSSLNRGNWSEGSNSGTDVIDVGLIFNQADLNRNSTIDQNEFTRWDNSGVGEEISNSSTNIQERNSFEVSSDGADLGADAGAIFNQVDLNRNAAINQGEFSQSGNDATGFNVGAGTIDTATRTRCNVPTYPTDASGHFLDPNPQIITRPATGAAPTYTQNIKIRFHQPPPLPPSGQLIIVERRAPQPPPPPPLRVRIPARPAPQPPPLILREEPPERPPLIPRREVTQIMPPCPAPPRSVIIEEFPPLPARPRDIIMERWIPYGPQRPRSIIRIPPPCCPSPTPPRNVIIQYQPVQTRVVRQFQRLSVIRMDPQAYLQQHGASLLDTATLLQLARTAGVVEDISPPAGNIGESLQVGAGGNISANSDLWNGASSSEDRSGEVTSLDQVNIGSNVSAHSDLRYGADTSGNNLAGGFDAIGTAFRNADTNNDSTLNPDEFSRFVQQGS